LKIKEEGSGESKKGERGRVLGKGGILPSGAGREN